MRFDRVALAVFALMGIAQIACAQTAPWDYRGKYGALAWGKLDPAYRACSEGHQQSPIDIRGAHRNRALKPIEFHYLAGGVTLQNEGHTIVARVHPGSYIVANGVRYDLVEYVFHHPGETAVNGRLHDMDIQFLHTSADGKLAILDVLLTEDQDAPNATLATLWQHLPEALGATETVTDMVNPGGLLPADRGYWTYMGSLTTPPCTEGVRWFVLEQPITLSRDQLNAFAALYPMNSRPLQDTHGRRIEANR